MTTKITRVVIPNERQYEYLDQIREDFGLTWRGLLIRGAERLESTSPFPDESDDARPSDAVGTPEEE